TDVSEDQGFHATALSCRPGLEPFELQLQVSLVPVPAHAPIEHQESPIDFADEPFHLRTWHTNLAAHRYRLNPTCFDLAPHVMGCRPNSWAAALMRKSLGSRLATRIPFFGLIALNRHRTSRNSKSRKR